MVDELPVKPLTRVNATIPIAVRAQVKTLYLVHGMSPKEIEAMGLGLSAMAISNLANREGWSQKRREALSKVEKSIDARTEAAVEAVGEALATDAEALCFKALDQTRAGLEAGGMNGAKQAQAASATLRNLHSVVQAIRKPAAESESGPINLNLFFASLPGNLAKTGEAKQAEAVTDIQAKPVQ